MAERERLRLAMMIPPFSRGSGGHNTLFQIFSRLERRGHACSVWLVDYYGYRRAVWPAVLRQEIREYFAPFEGPVYKDLDAWQGADVAIATGWQTVHAMLALDRCPRAPTSSTITSPTSIRPPPSTRWPPKPTVTTCTASRRARGCATC